MKEAEESIQTFNGDTDGVSDEEIDKLINCQATDKESDLDKGIDQKIESIRARVN